MHYSPIALFVVLSASLEGPKNGNKSAQVYPEHPSTRGMGVEANDLHLSDLINGRTEGNILNSKKHCLAHMNKFSAHRITRASLLKYYIFGTFIRHKAGTLQDALIIHLGLAMLLPLRWPILHQLLSIQLAPVHFSTGKGPMAPSIQTERLMTSSLE